MSEDAVEDVVEEVKKKVYLVVGVLPRDIRSVAQKIQINLEYETGKLFTRLSEQDLTYEYVEKNGLHPLCLKEWLEPIRNEIIISLLGKTENAIGNQNVLGVVIEGSFALDPDVRKAYIDILEEQGFEVVVVPVQSNFMSIIHEGWSMGTNLKSLYSMWKKYNQQFSRTYEPMEDKPTAILVDDSIDSPILIEMIQALSSKHQIIVLTKNKDTGYPFKVNRVMIGHDKIDIFWSKIAHHFNVKLVIDNDPNSVQKWHQIDVPVISLTSQYALEKNIC